LDAPLRITTNRKGTTYWVEAGGKIRKLTPDGKITTILQVAGANAAGGLAVDNEGFVYYASVSGRRLLKISPNGEVEVVAGSASGWSTVEDNSDARQAPIRAPTGVAVSPNGDVYFSDALSGKLFRLSTEGRLYSVYGGGFYCSEVELPDWDLGTACSSRFNSRKLEWGPRGLVMAPSDGYGGLNMSLGEMFYSYVQYYANKPLGGEFGAVAVEQLGTDGTARRMIGELRQWHLDENSIEVVNVIRGSEAFSVAPDGTVFFVDNYQIKKAVQPFPNQPGIDTVIASASGRESLLYDSEGRQIATYDALTGRAVHTFRYDANGLVLGILDGDGNETLVERDSSGRLRAFVAPFGQRTSVSLDSNGYISALANSAGHTHSFSYDVNGLMQSETDPKGNTHFFFYDQRGRLAKDITPTGVFHTLEREETTSFEERLANGNAFTVTLGRSDGRQTKFHQAPSYERYELEQRRTDATGVTSIERSGPAGSQLLSPDGTTITQELEADPRFGMQAPISRTLISTPAKIYSSLKQTREFTPMPSNPGKPSRLLEKYYSDYGVTTVDFNGEKNLRTTTTAEGRQVVLDLDENGKPESMQVGGLYASQFEYDSRGLLQHTKRGERTLTFAYDASGRPELVTDSLGRQTVYEYDAADRVIAAYLPGGRTVAMEYDANGNRTAIQPPGRPWHNFTYNTVDHLTGYYPPPESTEASETEFVFNPLSNELASIAYPDGSALTLSRDAAGRITAIDHSRGRSTFGYDYSTGQLTSISDPGGTHVDYAYDGFLLKSTAWTGMVRGTVSNTYMNGFRLKSETVTTGYYSAVPTVSFTYDNDGLLTKADLLSIERSTDVGLPMSAHLQNSHVYYAYNPYGEFTGSSVRNGALNITSSYARDNGGRVVSKAEAVNGLTTEFDYVYDEAGRLQHVDRNGQPWATYTYDSNGNRLSYTGSLGMHEATYDSQDRLLRYGPYDYAYSARGQLSERVETASGNTWSYSYDNLGNLISVSRPDGKSIGYLVDGANRRVGKLVDGVLQRGFLYRSQLQVVAELDASGSVRSRFVYGTQAHVPDMMIQGSTRYLLVKDQIGSVRFVVDAYSGAIAQELNYDEFGNVVMDTNPGFQPFGFAGGLYDSDTGFVRFGARDYDPFTGRWTAKDPILFKGGDTNLYGYVLNDPINLTDPNGMLAPQIVGAIVGLFAGGLNAHFTGGDVLTSALVGAGAGALSTLPIPGVNPLLASMFMGGVGGATGNLAGQVIGGGCGGLNYGSILGSAAAGIIGGGIGYPFARAQNATLLEGALTENGIDTLAASYSGIIAGILDIPMQGLGEQSMAMGQ
jgi:RHS repeat-associated protein